MHFDVILFPRELRHTPLRLYVQYRRREEFLYLCNYRYDLDEKKCPFLPEDMQALYPMLDLSNFSVTNIVFFRAKMGR